MNTDIVVATVGALGAIFGVAVGWFLQEMSRRALRSSENLQLVAYTEHLSREISGIMSKAFSTQKALKNSAIYPRETFPKHLSKDLPSIQKKLCHIDAECSVALLWLNQCIDNFNLILDDFYKSIDKLKTAEEPYLYKQHEILEVTVIDVARNARLYALNCWFQCRKAQSGLPVFLRFSRKYSQLYRASIEVKRRHDVEMVDTLRDKEFT